MGRARSAAITLRHGRREGRSGQHSAVRRLFVRLRLSRPDLCRQAQRRFVRYTLRKGHRRFLSVSGIPALYRGNE